MSKSKCQMNVKNQMTNKISVNLTLVLGHWALFCLMVPFSMKKVLVGISIKARMNGMVFFIN